MASVNLKNMDVDALLKLRSDVEKALADRGRDLRRQIALLVGEVGKRRGRPAGKPGRTSAMKGVKVAPKYRGPNGETWAGRGATPRWLAALVEEGHSRGKVFDWLGSENSGRGQEAEREKEGPKISRHTPAATAAD
jgi:DNA-binding protein H-NS